MINLKQHMLMKCNFNSTKQIISIVQYLPLQIAKLPQPRDSHCATAFVISSELTEVVLFGGNDQRNHHLSDTTTLRIGEFTDFNIIYFLAEVF